MSRLRIGTYFLLGSMLVLPSCDRAIEPVEDDVVSGSQLVERLAELSPTESSSKVSGAEVPEVIRRFCSDCHALPSVDSFERNVWYEEIRLGYEFYATSGRTDLDPPPLASVLRYYRENAPERIVFPDPPRIDVDWVARFSASKLDWREKEGGYVSPAVSSIEWLELMAPGKSHLVVTDMRDGTISLVDPDPEHTTRKMLCRIGSPARVTACDYDLDGHQDLVVSELGSFSPFDHKLGQVVLLRRQPESNDFEQVVLLEGLGRVADVGVGDFGGDHKTDLIVGEFGHRRRGGIHLMINNSSSYREPHFSTRTLDIRPGTIRMPAHDWDEDGNLDFAALISQEYESVELFLNRKDRFEMHNVFTGPDLSFGSSGIELVDLDQDGDQDILHTNGDSFDNNYANLSHGVGWHENLGNLRFTYHRLVDLPGAFRALASDMDNDGDTDVIVTAYLSAQVRPLSLRESNPVAILLLEQTESLHFVPHVLEAGTARYPALEVADFNNDGKTDFAVGTLLFGSETAGSPSSQLPRLTIWWQQ